MTAAFWQDMTNIIGTIIVSLQARQPQQKQSEFTQTGQTNRRYNYNEYALAALMVNANVFNTSDIPRIWGNSRSQKSSQKTDKKYIKACSVGQV